MSSLRSQKGPMNLDHLRMCLRWQLTGGKIIVEQVRKIITGLKRCQASH